MFMESNTSENTPVKRGRGRPPKVALTAAPRRGRPPKQDAAPQQSQPSMFDNLPVTKIASLEAAAMHCRCTGRTMKLYFEKYSDLAERAIKSRGMKGPDSWQIDLNELDRWRQETGFLVFDDESVGGTGPLRRNISATEKRAGLQAEKLEMEIARIRGEVLDKTEVVSKLRTAFAQLAKGLDNMPAKLGATCNLPGDVIEKMRDQLDTMRRALVVEIKDLLGPEQPVPAAAPAETNISPPAS